jgi:AP-1-like factor
MTNKEQGSGIFDPDFLLSPNEQDLLVTALNSNKPSQYGKNGSISSILAKNSRPAPPRSSSNPHSSSNQQVERTGRTSLDNINAFTSPTQHTPGSAPIGLDLGFEESPFLDFDLDDGNFDWDLNGEQMIGGLPGTSVDDEDGDLHDKRKASDDDGDENDGGGKRREGDDKQSKKPGRKPLTSEPTSVSLASSYGVDCELTSLKKRKAQNRAAQRAFRERKERHLKELETKVEDLEKASESTNHENGILRAQVERLQTELKEYRKRLSLTANTVNQSPPRAMNPMSYSRANWDFNNNFNFEFPVFGAPQPTRAASNGSMPKGNAIRQGSNGSFVASPTRTASGSTSYSSPNGLPNGNGLPQSTPGSLSRDNILDSRNFFSPSVIQSATRSTTADYLRSIASDQTNQSTDMSHGMFSPVGGLEYVTTSPSVSSNSQNGFNSCVTTPETTAESPENHQSNELNPSNGSEGERAKFCKGFQKACGNTENPIPLTLTESDESSAPSSALKTPGGDLQNFDWQFLQNGGAFDPVLFADYRDPQESIMNNDYGAYFNDAFPTLDPINPTHSILETNLPKKHDLMKEIESAANKEPEEKVVPADGPKQFLSCNLLWYALPNLQSTLQPSAVH